MVRIVEIVFLYVLRFYYFVVQVGLCTQECIILGAEKRAIDVLQLQRTSYKIKKIDEHIAMTFAGLTADARILASRAQMEAQSHRLNFNSPANVEHIARSD